MQDFPFKVGDIISTPDLIGGVTGLLVELERLPEPRVHMFYGKIEDVRTHRVKLAIIHTQSRTWKTGEVADFWPTTEARWKKL